MPVLTIGGGMPVLTIGRADADRPGARPYRQGCSEKSIQSKSPKTIANRSNECCGKNDSFRLCWAVYRLVN
jgi:hypothetical protein